MAALARLPSGEPAVRERWGHRYLDPAQQGTRLVEGGGVAACVGSRRAGSTCAGLQPAWRAWRLQLLNLSRRGAKSQLHRHPAPFVKSPLLSRDDLAFLAEFAAPHLFRPTKRAL